METPAFHLNADSVSYRKLLNRCIEEALYCQSSNHSKYMKADLTRLGAQLSALRFQLAFMAAQPEQDLPETNPREYPLEANPEIFQVENDQVNHVVNLLILARDEMDHSQTARMSSGINPFDLERQRDHYVARIETYIRDFVNVATPLDLPESSPRRKIQGAGRTGVIGPGK